MMFPVCLVQSRNFASRAQKTVMTNIDLLKNYNHDNKALYGSVINAKNRKRLADKLGSKTSDSSIPEESVRSSEMYWLLEHKHELQVEVEQKPKFKAKSKRNKIPTPKKVTSLGETLADLRSNIKCFNPKITQASEKIIAAASTPIEIPFTHRGLKSILKFPLIAADVLTAPEIVRECESHYPSVGKILQSTLSDSARKSLQKWKLEKIEELGLDGFNKLQEETLTEGKLFHKSLEDYLSLGVTPESGSPIHKLWESISPAIRDLQPIVEFTEKMIEHPFLKYRGIVDCVCTVRSDIAVIEWKKSDKVKNTIHLTFDAPLQLCAYLGALTADPRYKITAKNGFVIVANTNGLPAQIHKLDETLLRKYWQLWLHRLQEFWMRTRDGTLPESI